MSLGKILGSISPALPITGSTNTAAIAPTTLAKPSKPEPDVIHEVIGHGLKMASDEYARLYRRFGEATNRCADDDAVRLMPT